MEKGSDFIGFILILSYASLSYSEPASLGEPSLYQGSHQNPIFRHPVLMPLRPDQIPIGLPSNTFQNLIQSRRSAPAAAWRAAPAMVASPSQEFIQVPMQEQSERTNYAPVPLHPHEPVQSQINIKPRKPEQREEYPSQTQHGPIPGPVFQPVMIKDGIEVQSEFELKTPVPANTVMVECGEVLVKVHAQQDFLGNHQFINPSDLLLGGCPFDRFDEHANIIVFESALQACGSTLAMTEESLVYSFILMYSPSPIPNTPIVKTNEAMVAIHCIYPRKHNVSSNALSPTLIPYAATRVGEERLQFSLKLMTDDWRFEQPSSKYFLGELINLEASVVRANHVPLRVFVESCAATLGPSGNGATIYTFIGNNGCMIDAKLTGSRSTFMPRIQEDKLQFQIEAFRFKQNHSGTIYITCHLKATPISSPIDSVHKACSFVTGTNSWVAVDGDDHLCGCCESSCSTRKARSVDTKDSMLADEATVGPVLVEQTPPSEKHLLQMQESSHPSSKDAEFSVELVLLTGLLAVVGILCVIVLGLLFYQRRQKHLTLICE